jgi:hypothetical protein
LPLAIPNFSLLFWLAICHLLFLIFLYPIPQSGIFL